LPAVVVTIAADRKVQRCLQAIAFLLAPSAGTPARPQRKEYRCPSHWLGLATDLSGSSSSSCSSCLSSTSCAAPNKRVCALRDRVAEVDPQALRTSSALERRGPLSRRWKGGGGAPQPRSTDCPGPLRHAAARANRLGLLLTPGCEKL